MKAEIKYKTLMGSQTVDTIEGETIQFHGDFKILECTKDGDVTYYNMEYIQSVKFIGEKEKQAQKD